jgi:hypothetical protein
MSYPQAMPGPQQIIVPDLGAYKQQNMTNAPPPPARLLDVEIKWAGDEFSAVFINVAVGRDEGLGMIVLESQEEDGHAHLIPPSAIKWLKVSPTLAGSVAREEAEEEDWSAAQ